MDAGLLSRDVTAVLAHEKNYFSQAFLTKILDASEACRASAQSVLSFFHDHFGPGLIPPLGHHADIRAVVAGASSQKTLPLELLTCGLAMRISGAMVARPRNPP